MNFLTILLIAGLILLLIGLLGRIRIKDYELGTDNTPIRVIIGLLGAALLIGAFLLYRSEKPSPPDNTNAADTNTSHTPPPSPNITKPTPTVAPTQTLPRADSLIQIITKQQQENVRASFGELAGQNFSEKNLEEFKRKKVPQNIAEQLKTDNEFLDVVLAIKQLPPGERQRLLNRGLSTYKPTWEQLGGINPKGQTEAGQEAEKMIAQAIVDLVRRLSQLPEDDIKKLYT